MMELFQLYKHDGSNDVALAPVSVKETDEGLVVRCIWYNIHYNYRFKGEVFQCHSTYDRVVIKADDLKNWRPYEIRK